MSNFRRRRPALVTLALVASLAGGHAGAEVYKSVDADGNVIFSQTPPPGVKAETVKPRFSRAPQPAASGTAATSPRPAVAPPVQPSKGVPAGGKGRLTPEQLAIKARNCDNARGQVQQLTAPRANRLQYRNKDGELAFYTEEQRKQNIQAAEKAAKEFCE